MFNLGGDEEVLTHQGRSLQDVEKFDRPIDESDDEEDDGRLDGLFYQRLNHIYQHRGIFFNSLFHSCS